MSEERISDEVASLRRQVDELRERVETTQAIAVELGVALMKVINASLTVAYQDWSPESGTPLGDALKRQAIDPRQSYNEAFDAIAAALTATVQGKS